MAKHDDDLEEYGDKYRQCSRCYEVYLATQRCCPKCRNPELMLLKKDWEPPKPKRVENQLTLF